MDKDFEKIAQGDDKTPVEKKKPVAKKKDGEENPNSSNVKNVIDTEPTLVEAKGGTVVLGWGRMNPITVGHEKLANKIQSVARSVKGTPILYLTHSQDPKKNPLSYDDKVMLAKKAFGSMVQKSNAKTIIAAMQELNGKFDKVVLVVGQDRIEEFKTLLNKYNGKDYNFDAIEIVSAGDRDPDAEGVEGMSASKMRAVAAQGDMKSFVTGLPTKLKRMGQEIYDMVRAGMKLAEELEELGLLDEAVLNPMQRRARGIIMRRFKNKLKIARARAAKRAPTMDRVMKVAQKRARDIVRKRLSGQKDLNYSELDNAQKTMLDKKLISKKTMIKRIAKKIMPKVKKELYAKMSSKSPVAEEFNLEFEAFFEETKTPTQRFHEVRKKDGSVKLDRRFRAFKNAARPINELSNIDAAKQEVKREKEALAREHEREIRAAKIADARMESVAQDKDIKDREGAQPAKYHSGLSKSTKAKRDAHFKKGAKMDDNNPDAYKPAPGDATAKTKESQYTKKYKQMYGEEVEFENDIELLNMIEEVANEIWESIELDESKTDAALRKKADKSGISYGVLKKVYDRGVAAWRTGHRPGTTPPQWGMARVNSFITGGKTRTTGDADLAKGLREDVGTPKHHLGIGSTFKHIKQHALMHIDYDMDGDVDIDDFKKSVPDEITGAEKKDLTKAAFKKYNDEKKHTKKGVAFEEVDIEEDDKPGLWANIRKRRAQGLPRLNSTQDGYPKTLDIDEEFELFAEEGGAGDEGTDKLVKKYKKDTPNQDINEANPKQQMSRYNPDSETYRNTSTGGRVPNSKSIHKSDITVKGKRANFPNDSYEPNPLENIEKARMEKLIADALNSLTEKEATILKARFGIKPFAKEMTLAQIGKVLNVNAERIRQIEAKAMRKLKYPSISRNLRSLLDGINEEFESTLDEDFNTLMEAECQLIGIKQIKEFERVVDDLFKKFGIDFNFTKHFGERMSDERNTPCITLKELADFIKKIYAKQGKSLKGVAGAEAVIKDLQSDLNIPVAVTYDSKNDEFDVVMKTIMRKKNFKTPNKVITY